MTLYQKLAEVESKVAGIEVALGIPERRNLLVRHQILNQTTRVYDYTDTLILPQPYITSVPLRLVNLPIEGANSITIQINDIQVEIPRTFSKSLFTPEENTTTARFILDPPISNNQVIYTNPTTKTISGATFYRMIMLMDNDPTLWKLILRKEKDSK
jgi:hypothetical protein